MKISLFLLQIPGIQVMNMAHTYPICHVLCTSIFNLICIQARLAKKRIIFWPAFVTRSLTPRSQKSGYGLLLGCRLPLDGGHEKNFFCYAFPPQKTVKSSSDGRARHRNRSGVVILVGREPLIIARVENGVTKLSPQRQKMPKCKNFKTKFQFGD